MKNHQIEFIQQYEKKAHPYTDQFHIKRYRSSVDFESEILLHSLDNHEK